MFKTFETPGGPVEVCDGAQTLDARVYRKWERVINATRPDLVGKDMRVQLAAFPLMQRAFERGFTKTGAPQCLAPLSPWCRG